MKSKLLLFLKGFIVGGSMLVPGVSGGTMAMLLGIYDQLISSITAVAKRKWKRLPFILTFGVGAVLGLVLLARPLKSLIELFPKPTLFFFLGAVVGGIPIMVKKAAIKRFSWNIPIALIIGFSFVFSLRFLPANLLVFSQTIGVTEMIVLFFVGIAIAVALVLPGISTTHMLLVLGLLDRTLSALSTLDLKFLIPLGIGGLGGIFLTTGIIEKALQRFPQITYTVIVGFVIGSVIELQPGIPSGAQIPICIVLFAIAAFTMYKLSALEKE